MNPTLFEIMANEYEITAKRCGNNAIRLSLKETNDAEAMHNKVSNNWWDELVYFAKQIISENEKLEAQDE